VGRNDSAFGIRDDDWWRRRRWPSDGGGDYLDLFLTPPLANKMTDLRTDVSAAATVLRRPA
jgi:hypothetical protein